MGVLTLAVFLLDLRRRNIGASEGRARARRGARRWGRFSWCGEVLRVLRAMGTAFVRAIAGRRTLWTLATGESEVCFFVNP
jgi:hypothetical protein